MQRQQPANTIRKCCSVAKGVLLKVKRTIQTKQLHTNETKTHRPSKTARVVQPYTPLHLVQTNLTRVRHPSIQSTMYTDTQLGSLHRKCKQQTTQNPGDVNSSSYIPPLTLLAYLLVFKHI